MWTRTENCWKRSQLFYILPSIVYYQDSGFLSDRSITFAWLCFSVEVGVILDL